MTMPRIRRRFPFTSTSLVLSSIAALAAASMMALPTSIAHAAPAPQGRTQPSSAAQEKPQPVDLNTADLDQLTTVPGIGPALAQRILEYRKENGPFKKIDDLLNVRGIGERSLARIRDRVTVGGKS